MKFITSPYNNLYKELKLLASSSQVRRKTGRTLLDGVHLCQAYLQQNTPIVCVASESALPHAEVTTIIERCKAAHVECIAIPDMQYKVLSQVENGIGLLFMIAIPQFVASAALTQSAVLLDNLQDPGNVGSVLRSAAAAGIKYIYCSAGTALAWSPKVLRAGMGAHFLLEIFENIDLADVIANAQVPVLATSSYAQRNIYDIDLCQPLAWLFGHEGQGVDYSLLQQANEQVAIPHTGKMESLNVAAAAAVCFFEQARQIKLNIRPFA